MVLYTGNDNSTVEKTAQTKAKGNASMPNWDKYRKPSSTKHLLKQAQHKKVSLEKLTMFCQQLSSMLQAGLPLSHALDTIVAEMDDKVFRAILTDIKEKIFEGESFSSTVKQYPKTFPPLFAHMIEAGEAAGSLPSAMETLSNYFQASLKLNKKFKSALTYPIAIISMSFLLVSGLMIWVVPVFGEMFGGFGAKLPWLTQKMIDTSNLLKENLIPIALAITALIYFIKNFIRTKQGALLVDILLAHIPIFGVLSKKTNLARFCRTYSVLLTNGVPILKSIDICTNVANSYYLTQACGTIKKGIQEGKQLSALLESIPYFPKMVCNMARAGEQAGNVENMIRNVAVLYENDVNNLVGALTSLLEPMIICFLGVVIGFIVVAMFLPIFQLSSLVN